MTMLLSSVVENFESRSLAEAAKFELGMDGSVWPLSVKFISTMLLQSLEL